MAPGDAVGGDVEIRGLVDNGRILPAEFEQDRREVFRGRAHDDLADCGTAGKEDEVERQLQQLGDFLGGEILRNDFLEQRRRRRRGVGRLEDHRVAGRECGDRRIEQQQDRRVERTDHEGDAVWLLVDDAAIAGGFQSGRDRHRLRRHQFLEMFAVIADHAGRHGDLEQLLERRLAEVLIQRGAELVLMFAQHAFHAFELVDAPRVRLRRIAEEMLALRIEQRLESVRHDPRSRYLVV